MKGSRPLRLLLGLRWGCIYAPSAHRGSAPSPTPGSTDPIRSPLQKRGALHKGAKPNRGCWPYLRAHPALHGAPDPKFGPFLRAEGPDKRRTPSPPLRGSVTHPQPRPAQAAPAAHSPPPPPTSGGPNPSQHRRLKTLPPGPLPLPRAPLTPPAGPPLLSLSRRRRRHVERALRWARLRPRFLGNKPRPPMPLVPPSTRTGAGTWESSTNRRATGGDWRWR